MPNQSAIVVNLQDIQNDAKVYLKAKKIDLFNDEISFNIYKK